MLQERAWLNRSRNRADQVEGLGWLGEHAWRHQNRPALLQHRAQSIEPDTDTAKHDLVALRDLLAEADPEHVWGLAPALRPAVELALRQRFDPLLTSMQALVQASSSPFRYTIFPDHRSQVALEDLLFVGGDAGTDGFGTSFVRLCDAWPYRVLFVAAPYGRRGEQLSESVY